MDSYEATRIVFSRIQGLDPENAPKIMGLLLIQDHGEKEMIRLAFGPEALIQSVVLKAKKELGLHSSSPSTSPSTPSSPSPFLSSNSSSAGVVSRHGLSMSRLLPPVTVPSPGPWSPSPGTTTAFSRNGEDLQNSDELLSPNTSYTAVNSMVSSPFYGEDLHIDELQLPDHLSFLNVTSGVTCPPIHSLSINKGDLYYPDECRSPGDSCSSMDSLSFPYWGVNGHPHHRRSCSAVDFCPDSAGLGSGIGWKPCLYFARGFCKNGSSCRFVHGLSDPVAEMGGGGGGKMDGVMVEQCQQELLRSKSLRLSSSPSQQFMASATSFPYGSPVASSKCMNFLMQQQQHHHQQQQQQNDVQRSAMAAAAALMLGDEPQNRFMRSRMERGDFLGNGIVNPGSRQIYLTFPADSTFREEDVSNYFSLYGPVQDVRIPYQQKRMFGFVTFVYPETVKLILAKGNPHFVCDARVLVKPYKEKGKVPDKKQQQHQQQQHTQERGGGDFSACSTPTGLDSRENPYDLQLGGGGRPLYNNGVMAEEATLRRKLEEQSDLQQAIEIQGRRLLNLQLLEMNQHHHGPPYHHLRPPHTSPPTGFSCPSPGPVRVNNPFDSGISGSPPEKSTSPGATAGIVNPTAADDHHQNKQQQHMVERGGGGLEDEPDARESACDGSPPKNDFGFRESVSISEHNLPESPFASPTKSYFTASSTDVERAASPAATTLDVINSNDGLMASSLLPSATSPVDMPSLKACFFQIPRFSSGHGAVGM